MYIRRGPNQEEVVYVGEAALLQVGGERTELQKLLLLAAAHAVLNIRFGGVGRHTLCMLYIIHILGFSVPMTAVRKEARKKLKGTSRP